MSKKALSILIALALCLGLAASGLAADTIELSYSNFFPPTHTHSKLAQAWCDEVAKRTDGRVKVQYFPGGTLTKATQAYDGVINGLSDLAMGAFAYTRGRFPVMAVADLPLGYENGVQATKAVNQIFNEIKPAETDQVQVMYLHAHGPGLLHTKDKPVKTLEDLKSLKIRATGTTADLIKALGGTPVAMPMPETYQALSRGVVDGSVYPVESNQGWKLAEVVKYQTQCFSVGYTTSFFVVMNKAKWEKLPEDIKKIITEINQEWIGKTGEAWDQADQEGQKVFMGLPGRETFALSDEESAKWKTAAQPVLDDFVKSLSDKGMDGAKVLKVAQDALATSK